MNSSKIDCYETPSKMALSVARSASPDSSGKEILQRFRALVAQKNAERTLNSPGNKGTDQSQSGVVRDQSTHAEDNKGKGELSVFEDSEVSVKNVQSCEEQSVKNRIKQSLAQRRTALQSRNLNVPINNHEEYTDLKKKSKGIPSQTQHSKKSTKIESAEISKIDAHSDFLGQDRPVEKEFNDEAGNSSESQISLELDVSINEDENSGQEDSYTTSVDSSERTTNDMNPNYHENLQPSQVYHLDPLPEESEQKDSEEDDEEPLQSHRENFEREHGELISFFEYCASINSKSSSHEGDDQAESDNNSPRSYSVSDGSSLTPAASLQTFSVTSALSQRSHATSPFSGITPTGSVQTFSLGGRSLTITSDPLKMSMFSPHFRSAVKDLSRDNEYESEPSYSGNTVIPEISIQDGCHMFPTPTHRMLYASPTAKVNLSQDKGNLDENVCSVLDELERQLIAVRSEQKESNQKIALSTKHARKILQMYDRIHAEVDDQQSKTSMNIDKYQVVSPVSKALATGDSSGLSRAAAASLIERNKTLVKEVRFADQTCVELSEKNVSLVREKEKLEADLREMKSKNDELHANVLEASLALVRAEERNKDVEGKLSDEKQHFTDKIQASYAALAEEKERCRTLQDKLEKSLNALTVAEQNVSSTTAKYMALREDHNEAKETISSLRDRLTTIESTNELSAASAAERYREAASEMQKKVESLQDELEEKDVTLGIERNARHRAEEEVMELREKIEQLETDQHYTDTKHETNSPCRSFSSMNTTSSVVLAKTLKVEMEKNHEVTERIIEAEKIIAVTQSKLKDTEHELQIARKESSDLRLELEKCKSLNNDIDESFTISSRNDYDHHFRSNLSYAKSQCEEYKRELDLIIAQIKGIQCENSFPNGLHVAHQPQNPEIVQTCKELMDVCAKINVATDERVIELEERIKFLMRSMHHLHNMCVEECSADSGTSYCLEMMEQGNTPVKENSTPVKMCRASMENEAVSPLGYNGSLKSPSAPDKFLQLCDELKAVKNEKDSLRTALLEARHQIMSLTTSLDKSASNSEETRQVQEEKKSLEKVLLNVRSHAVNLEEKIKSLEEDKIFLRHDAAAHEDELRVAKDKIVMLEKEYAETLTRLEGVEKEKLSIQEKLHKVESNERELINNAVNNLELLREAETSANRLREELDLIRHESSEQVSMIHQLQESLAHAKEEASELKHSYMMCNEDLASIVDTKAQLEVTNIELMNTIRKAEKELSTKTQQIEVMTSEMSQLQMKLKSTEDAYDFLHEELVRMGSQVDDLGALNDIYQSDCENAKEAMKSMENEIVIHKRTIDSLESTLEKRDQEVESAMEEIMFLKNELMEKNSSYETEIRSKTQQLVEVEDKLEETKNSLKAVDVSRCDMLAKHEAEVGALKTELNELSTKYEGSLEKINQLEQSSSSLSDEFKEKYEQVSILQRRNESLERKCKRMREYVKNLTNKCKEWEDTYSERENIMRSSQRKYEEAMSKIADLTSQMNASCTSASVASSHTNHTSNSITRKAYINENHIVMQLKDDIQKKNMKIRSLKRRLLERSMLEEKGVTML